MKSCTQTNTFALALLIGCSSSVSSPTPQQVLFDSGIITTPIVQGVDAFTIIIGPGVNQSGPDVNVSIVPADAAVDVNKVVEIDKPRCGDGKTEDVDGDGFTSADGDCDDCLKTVNPAAFDVPGNGIDENCNGNDASEAKCDQGLAIDSRLAEDGARAIDLCTFTTAESKSWGVISARYTDANGTGAFADPLAAGLLPGFGAAKPRGGKSLLALSSGTARAPDQPGYTRGCDTFDSRSGKPPAGYPKESSICDPSNANPGNSMVYNQAALELKIRVPSNANAFAFESIFYTLEYPDYICQPFNDFFVVFKDPKPAQAEDGNIVFDANRDPIGVNTGLLAVCDPSDQSNNARKTFTCDQGTGLLLGTGYGPGESTCGAGLASFWGGRREGGASTGWLKTTAPVTPGEIITLRFVIWDTNDAVLDSTVLIDHFQWFTYTAEPEKQIPDKDKPKEIPVVPVETIPIIIK